MSFLHAYPSRERGRWTTAKDDLERLRELGASVVSEYDDHFCSAIRKATSSAFPGRDHENIVKTFPRSTTVRGREHVPECPDGQHGQD